MSISGIQQKLSLKRDSENKLVMTAKAGEYILKPSPEAFPHAAENEQCAMALSHLAGIPTAVCALIPFSDGEFAYLTRRYDRIEGKKLHQEDLAQGFNISSSGKYSKSYEECLALVHSMSGGKMAVVRELYKRIIFAWLIGNDDMHLKNISLIRKEDNRTPFYDSLTPSYDQLFASSFSNSLKIGYLALDLLKEEHGGIFSTGYQKLGYYTSADFKELGYRAGLLPKAIKSVIDHFINLEDDMTDMIFRSYMPDLMKQRAADTLKHRFIALKQ
ncbi:MAG: HipA domain-containing protein [Spirochaetales bacterium]|nr:HipA domain-containing protein [Spirochaetales bacterium]